ncbi:fluoride efflux transporter CrcB [Flavisolibacter ginsenosidimutans]|uniref:Fluoride-specific ion channel FluC n=1 Tax=Flavisolibacter ginsenosidimutans TaxID=661481 RepID=A0A5B8UGB0_9BACT|nr:fluoride efflux transporter CrcB [Flavisolibacter ginsenosidimutans]QEC55634.1 fluoride efflux transporter CrcB [Flavisolibacter ginsenosidimutans]
MMQIVVVAVGGAAGSVLRYTLQKWINETYLQSFPLATFLINVTGCLLIGIFYAMAEKGNLLTPLVRLLLVTGFCGGFTTFSTFAFENMNLLRSGDLFYFALYALGSLVLGVLAVYLGVFLVQKIGA